VIKALVSLEMDLAASRAIRFSCQLGCFIQMEIQPVYIKESPPRNLSIGSGWARRHWEQEIVAQGEKEITEMLSSEVDFCSAWRPAQVILGDRDAELLGLIKSEPFDLYVEGIDLPWSSAWLHQRLQSNLFQGAHIPIALAPVLRKIYELLVLCPEPQDLQALAPALARLWSGCSVPISLAVPGGREAALQPELEKAQTGFKESGCQVSVQEGFPYYPTPPDDEFLRKYGLVALALKRGLKKDHPGLVWLSRVKVPVIVMLY
jgi:hypothetical protein